VLGIGAQNSMVESMHMGQTGRTTERREWMVISELHFSHRHKVASSASAVVLSLEPVRVSTAVSLS